MDLKYNTDASLLFGPVIWNGDGYSVITNAFSLCCNAIALDLFNDTTKTDIYALSGGTNDVVFIANGFASIQLVASQVDAVGHYTLSYQYTSTIPGWRYFEVIQPEAWDARYGTLASNIVNIKAGTTSLAIGVASLIVGVQSISVNVASIFRDVTSANVNINRFEASTTVGVASILSRVSAFSASAMRDITSISVNVASIFRDVTSANVNIIRFEESTTVGVASVLARISAFSASAMRDITSISVNVASVFRDVTSANVNILRFEASTTIGVASVLARISAFSASTMRDLTSVAINVASTSINVAAIGSADSVASAVWGHTTPTSLIIDVKAFNASTAIGIASILVNVKSVAGSVWDVVRAGHVTVGTFGEVTSESSLASAVWGHTTSVSLIVAVKSTLSNAIYCTTLDNLENAVPGAYGVGTAGRVLGQIYVDTTSTLAGVTSLIVTTASVLDNVKVGVASIQVSTASILVGISSLMVDTASMMVKLASLTSAMWDEPLSQHSTVGVAGAYLYGAGAGYTPADMAEAVWEFATSQQSTIGMAGAYLMAAGAAADPLLNAVPGSYGVGTAGRVLGQIYVDTTSTVASVRSILVATTSIAIGVNSAAVGVASLLANQLLWGTSAAIATASLLVGVTSIMARMPAALVGGRMDSSVGAMADNVITSLAISTDAQRRIAEGQAISVGTCRAGSTYNNILLKNTEPATNDYYNGCLVTIVAGTGAGQARLIADYTGATWTAIVDNPWVTAPAVDSQYRIFPFYGILLADTGLINIAGTDATHIQLATTAPAIADTYVGHTVFISGGTGIGQARIITGYTNTRICEVRSWDTALDATSIYMILPVGRVYVNEMSASTLIAINAEVVDALNVDTYAEPGQETPAATNTLVKKIGYLYKNWRNRKTATSTAISIFNDDAVTVDQKADQTDNGTTYDKGEIETGP